VYSRFTLGGLLGSGGSASVFQATDSLTGDVVAIKVLHPHFAVRAELVSRFLEEAENVHKVNHPNMTTVIDWGSEKDAEKPTSWITYELAEGMSLAEYVELNGPLSAADAVTMSRGVLAALGAFHGMGLVHRDVSPQNVILHVTPDIPLFVSDVRLIDYGLVGKTGTSTRNGSGVVGNAHFISPEQARGDGVYPSGDIYQAGGVLYFALTGQTPFSASTTEGLVSAHAEQTPPVPSSVVTGIPRELDRAVVKALLKSPMMRYRNVDEFSRSLSAIFGRDELSTEVIPIAHDEWQQTKVLSTSSSSSFVDYDRTMLLSASYSEALQSESVVFSRGRFSRKNIRIATWIWPTSFAGLLAATLIVSVVSAQPGLRESAVAIPATSPPQSQNIVSPSPEQSSVVIPDVSHLPKAEAQQALIKAGFQIGAEKTIDSSLTAELVDSTDPSAGVTALPNSRVTLRIASGRNRVPQVAGLGQVEATGLLVSSGFNVTLINLDGAPQLSSTVPTDAKVSQLKPSAGSLLRVGSTVIIVVNTSINTPVSSAIPSPEVPVEPSMTPNPVP
jgi:serine/threonine protein kinase